MDAKITLAFDKKVIEKAKAFAEANNISLSRLTEFIYRQLTIEPYKNLEELPISNWVNMLAEGEATYHRSPRSRKETKSEFFQASK